MANDLVSPADLAGFPGAPFTEAEVDAAAAAIRTAAGWHIAPVRVDVAVRLDVTCWEPTLRLPTRRLVSLDAVRNSDTAEVIDASRYRVSHARARARLKGGFWPHGYESVEVDMTHGFDACPLDLLPILAQYSLHSRRDGTVRTVRVDDASVSYGTGATSGSAVSTLAQSEVLARYALPEWPGMA